MKLYVKFEKPKTVRQFLKNVFSIELPNNLVNSCATYFDEECTKTQCPTGKRRSLEDLYDLTKTYFPSITYKKLFIYLISLDIKDGHNTQCNTLIYSCNDIRKISFTFYDIPIKGADNYGYKWINNLDKKLGKFSGKEMLEMAGINSEEEFLKIALDKK